MKDAIRVAIVSPNEDHQLKVAKALLADTPELQPLQLTNLFESDDETVLKSDGIMQMFLSVQFSPNSMTFGDLLRKEGAYRQEFDAAFDKAIQVQQNILCVSSTYIPHSY